MRVRPLVCQSSSAATVDVGLRTIALWGLLLSLAAAALPGLASGQSLSGGKGVMRAQNRQAQLHDFTRLKDPSHVNRFVELGLIVPVKGNSNYRLHGVSFPYARPEVLLFVERLSRQYRNACGEQLVVTSLTRPVSRQPSNSSDLSVHPMGMAVDLRRSTSRGCRAWLEDVLLHIEGQGALDVTLERRPWHYHIAVYPRQYASYVAALETRNREAPESRTTEAHPSQPTRYTVRSGDSLWGIARSYGTTVDELKSVNNLRGSRIYAGQLLQLPTGS